MSDTNIRDPAAEVRARLARDYAHLIDISIKAAGTFSNLPEKYETPAQQEAGKVLLLALRADLTKVEEAMKAEVKPHDDVAKATKLFFGEINKAMTLISSALNERNTSYVLRLEREEREKREAESRRKADEAVAERERAEAAAAKAATAQSPAMRERYLKVAGAAGHTADSLEDRSRQALMESAAPAKVLIQEGGEGKSAIRTNWLFEITDLSKVPLETLRPFIARNVIETAIRKVVTRDKAETKLAGVRVYPDRKAVVT